MWREGASRKANAPLGICGQVRSLNRQILLQRAAGLLPDGTFNDHIADADLNRARPVSLVFAISASSIKRPGQESLLH
jgi:hypothetical protein